MRPGAPRKNGSAISGLLPGGRLKLGAGSAGLGSSGPRLSASGPDRGCHGGPHPRLRRPRPGDREPLVELRVDGAVEATHAVARDPRAVLEAMPGAAADEPHVREVGMTVDGEVGV